MTTRSTTAFLAILILSASGCLNNGLVDGDLVISVTIQDVQPPQVEIFGGESVSIVGLNFEPGASLFLDGEPIEATRLSSTVLTFVSPEHERGPSDIEIRLPDGRSGGCHGCLTFVQPAIRVDSIEPAAGPTSGGTAVTISGADFPADVQVFFGERALALDSVERGAIRLTTPPAGHGPVTVSLATGHPDDPPVVLPSGFRYHRQDLEFQQDLSLGTLPVSSAFGGDINGDGFEDLFLPRDYATFGGPQERPLRGYVMLADGNGGFGEAREYTTDELGDAGPVALDLYDWNGDGRDDLMALGIAQGSGLAIWAMPGLPDGTFGQAAYAADVQGGWEDRFQFLSGDVNGDGLEDLALVEIEDDGLFVRSSTVTVQIRNEDGSLEPMPPFSTSSYGEYYMDDHHLLDLDGDGKAELVVYSWEYLPPSGYTERLVFHGGLDQEQPTETELVDIERPGEVAWTPPNGSFSGFFDEDDRRSLVRPTNDGLVFIDVTAEQVEFSEQDVLPSLDKDLIYGTQLHRSRRTATCAQVSYEQQLFPGHSVLMGLCDGPESDTYARFTHFLTFEPVAVTLLDADLDSAPEIVAIDETGDITLVPGHKRPEAVMGGVVALQSDAQANKGGPFMLDADSDEEREWVTVDEQATGEWLVSIWNFDGRTFDQRQEIEIDPASWSRLPILDALAADFDGDGHTDLALSQRRGIVQLLPGADQGAYLPSVELVLDTQSQDYFTTYTFVGFCDATGDGRPDLLLRNHEEDISGGGYTDWVEVHQRNDQGEYELAGRLGESTPIQAWSADVDGDGTCELLVQTTSSWLDGAPLNNLALLRFDPALPEPFVSLQEYDFASEHISMNVEQLQGRGPAGEPLIVLSSPISGGQDLYAISFSDGVGGDPRWFTRTRSRYATRTGDFDGDGLRDLLVVSREGNNPADPLLPTLYQVFRGPDLAPDQERLLNFSDPLDVRIDDLDDDGLSDILSIEGDWVVRWMRNVAR